MNYCKDCVHGDFRKVLLPAPVCGKYSGPAIYMSPVHGEIKYTEMVTCSAARKDEGRCKAEGLDFERRPSAPPRRWWQFWL